MPSERRARPMFRAGAQVLRRVHGIAAEQGGGMPCPARVVEKPARQRDAIRMAVGNDRLRLVRVDDHPDRLHRNAAGFLDGSGERHLVARRGGRACGRTDAAGGDADVIEANVAQLAGKYAASSGTIPPSTQSVPVIAHAERLLARPDLADRGGHFERIAHAVGEATAVGIRSSIVIGERKLCSRKPCAPSHSTSRNPTEPRASLLPHGRREFAPVRLRRALAAPANDCRMGCRKVLPSSRQRRPGGKAARRLPHGSFAELLRPAWAS